MITVPQMQAGCKPPPRPITLAEAKRFIVDEMCLQQPEHLFERPVSALIASLLEGTLYICPLCNWIEHAGQPCTACRQIASIADGAEPGNMIFGTYVDRTETDEWPTLEESVKGQPWPEYALGHALQERAQEIYDGTEAPEDERAWAYACAVVRSVAAVKLINWLQAIEDTRDGGCDAQQAA